MLIGDPQRFAVQYELDENHAGVWLYGCLCYWAGGRQFGDDQRVTSLRDALFAIEMVLRDVGKRAHEELFAMPAAALYRRLDDLFYADLHSPDYDRAMDEQWARFQVTPGCESLAGWKLFLVERGDEARLLINDSGAPETSVHEYLLRAGEHDQVLQETQRALDALHERERALEQASGHPDRDPP